MGPALRVLCVTASLLCAALAAAPRARACGSDPGAPAPPPSHQPRPLDDALVASMVIAGSAGLTFLGLDIGFAADGRPLPGALGAAQAIHGALSLAGSVALIFGGSLGIASSCGISALELGTFTTGLVFQVLGTWLLAHGIWSTQRPARAPVEPQLAIGRDGGGLGLAVRF